MNSRLLAISLILITMMAGCDSAFFKEVDVDRGIGEAITVDSVLGEQVIEVIRSYALEHDLQCQHPDGFLIRCARTPRQVFAFRTQGGVTVCYASGGIPTEWAKNSALTQQLESELSQRFGIKRVFSSPMSSSWTDRCQRGVISSGILSHEK